ncbi:hypothetical protein MMC25_005480 [Agyrium rufum]|nr:hypothetical protein [Agyrium rufum]
MRTGNSTSNHNPQGIGQSTTKITDGAVAITSGQAAQKPKEIEKRSLDYALRSGLAGGLAGCAAKTVVGPLDRVKILFQASNPQFAKYTGSWFGVIAAMRDINSTDGVRGLFRGHSATLLRIFPYAAIKFLAYEQIRGVIIPSDKQETPLRRLVSGSLAGITSVAITYPLEVIRVRLAFETKKDFEHRSTLSGICRQIYHERPPPYSPGPAASRVAAVAHAPPAPAPYAAPVRAAASTLEATSATIHAIAPRAGVANFYRGFSPTLWGMLPYAGVSFLAHDTAGDVLRSERFAQYSTVPGVTVSSRNPKAKLKNWAELLSGAVAGLVGQTASYPLEIVRRRMQVGGAVGDGKRIGMAETMAMVWRERGFAGFWVGLGIGYLKVVPMAAVSFWVYERGKGALGI